MHQAAFINNADKQAHSSVIAKLINAADEIWFATAFLKSSGLKLIIPELKRHLQANKPINIICGKHFGLTEPAALKDLHNLFLNKTKSFLYMDRGESKTSVFHPKVFAFRIGHVFHIISGSANITQGGLQSNEEFSIHITCSVEDAIYTDTVSYFDRIKNNENAELVTLILIHRYESFYKEQKAVRKQQKIVPDKSSVSYNFDYEKLNLRLKEFDWNDFKKQAKEREKDYKRAKVLLDEIVDSKISQRRFEEIIDDLVGKAGQWGLWRSGSLLRLRFRVYKHKKEFANLVSYIRNNSDQHAGKVFSEAKRIVEKIEGARMNYVAEIMMTYQPKRFANINSNPIKVLKDEAGVYFKSHSDSFNAEDYENYCQIIHEIGEKLGLKNMLEADSFFNEIYWKIK